jgi:branched-chain amino acid transport system permease protein
VDVATTILMTLVLTRSLRLEISTGQLNMAHISFMGIGAYASTILMMRGGYSFWITLWVAVDGRRLGKVPIGGLALRVSGPYYVLITFAFSEVVRLIFNNFFAEWFGGPSGLVQIPKPDPLHLAGVQLTFVGKVELYYLMCALLLLAAAVLVRLDYSRFGLAGNAIRQGDVLAETLVWVTATSSRRSSSGAHMGSRAFAHSHQVLHHDWPRLMVSGRLHGDRGTGASGAGGTVVLRRLSRREFHYYEILVYGRQLILTMLPRRRGSSRCRESWVALSGGRGGEGRPWRPALF